MYNLALLNQNEDGTSDDLTVSDNQDRNKILGTVTYAIYLFTNKFPDRLVFFAGNTPSKSRLYRMAINIHFDELRVDFQILGVHIKPEAIIPTPFKKGTDYSGFLIKKNNAKFIL